MAVQDILNQIYTHKPLIFAHRGASGYAPMNTLPAFELARELGADGIELDVQLSRDGEAVIMHDFTVDNTTDGQGAVAEMTFGELRALDAGASFSDEFAGVRIPTLAEVFAAVGQDLIINVEIKSVSQDTGGMENVIAEIIRAHNMVERVIISSFNPMILHNLRENVPELALGYLFSNDIPAEVRAFAAGLTYEAEHPHYKMIDATLIAQARAAGRRVNAWTVDAPEEAIRLRDLGVDSIITDYPDRIRDAFAE